MAKGMGHPAKTLTNQQDKFIDGLFYGLSNTKAAEYAGYAHPHAAAYNLMRHPKIITELKKRRTAAIDGDMSKTALATIDAIMTDQTAPAQTRFSASKYILELAGHHAGDESGQDKDLSEMDAEELSRAVSSGMQALSELAGKLDGHHIIDGQITKYIDAGDAEIVQPDNGTTPGAPGDQEAPDPDDFLS